MSAIAWASFDLAIAEEGEAVGRRRAFVALLLGEHVEQLLLEAGRTLEIGHAALVAELGELRRLGDRLVHSAEAVDQAELVGGAAVPHAALRDLVDLLRGLAGATGRRCRGSGA